MKCRSLKFAAVVGVVIILAVCSGCGGKDEQPQSRVAAPAPDEPAAESQSVEIPAALPAESVAPVAEAAAPAGRMPESTPAPKAPGIVTGQVLDDLTSATVATVLVKLSDAFTTAVESLDGAFEFAGLPLGDYTIRAGAEGYSTATLTFSLSDAATSRQLALRLPPRASVAGRVELAGGEPLADATVYISYSFHLDKDSTRKNGPETQSAGDGTFLITDVQTGRTFNVVATHPEYALNYKGMFKLNPGHREEGVVIVLQPGGVIRGVVRDSEGKPIAGAEVRAGDAGRQMMGNNNMMRIMITANDGEKAETDEEGRFEYTNLPERKYLILAQIDGYQTNFVDNVALKSGGTVEDIEIILTPGAVFSGIVQNSAGEPVVSANINLSMIDLQRPIFSFKQTDEEGRFKFDTLRPGRFMMQVRADGYPEFNKMNQTVPEEDAVIVLPAGGRLMGRVTRESDGKPVSKFTVRVKKAPGLPLPFSGGMTPPSMPNTKTIENDDGRYEITGLEAGLYIAMVLADDYAPAQKMGVMIEDDKETTQDFELNQGLVLKGRVVDKSSGNPLSGAKVNLKESTGGMDMLDMMGIDELANRSTLKTQTTNVDGEFAFAHLMPGSIKLQATAKDFVDQEKLTTIEKDMDNEVEILMERGATIRGRVVDAATNEPLGGAKVSLAQSGMFGRMFAEFRPGEQTGADGVFMIRAIPEGKAGVVVNRDGYAMLTTDKITVYNGQVHDIGDVAMTGGGRIAGAVTQANKPVSGAAITAMGPSGIKMTSTDEEGRYEIPSLEQGTYQVSLINSTDGGLIFGGNMQTLQKNTSVKDGETTELDFEIPGGHELSGVVLKAGQPVENWVVTYGPKGGATSSDHMGGGFTNTDAEGRFTFTGLENGEYQVGVSKGMLTPGTIPIPALTRDIVIEDANVYLELSVPGASLGGVVVNEETGAPVVSAAIHLFEEGVAINLEDIMAGSGMSFYSAQTGADGRFLIEDVEEKTWEIVVQHEDYSPAQLTVALGEGEHRTDLRIELKKGVTLKGRAYSVSTGVRVPRVTLQFFDAGGGGLKASRTVTTDAQGNFTIPGLGAGSFSIEAFAENYAPVVGRSITLTEDADNQIVLQFPEGGGLALHVADEGGTPVNRARAQITLEQTGRTLQYPVTIEHLIAIQEWTYTNEQGRLTHPLLPAGAHLLTVTREGFQPSEHRIDVIEGQTTPLTVTLKKDD